MPTTTTYRVENIAPDRPRRVVRHGLTKERAESEAARLNEAGHDGEYVTGENLPDPYGERGLFMVSAEAEHVYDRCGTFAQVSAAFDKAMSGARSDYEGAMLRRAAVNRGRVLRRLGAAGVPATGDGIGAAQTTADLAELGGTDEEVTARRALLAS